MAENISISCHIKNETGNDLTVAASKRSWGKFVVTPHTLSNSTQGEAFKACGRSHWPSGTTGYVIYEAADGTQFKIDFDISWGSKANSVSHSMPSGHGNPANYVFNRTDSHYDKEINKGDPGSSPVTVYYLMQRK